MLVINAEKDAMRRGTFQTYNWYIFDFLWLSIDILALSYQHLFPCKAKSNRMNTSKIEKNALFLVLIYNQVVILWNSQ